MVSFIFQLFQYLVSNRILSARFWCILSYFSHLKVTERQKKVNYTCLQRYSNPRLVAQKTTIFGQNKLKTYQNKAFEIQNKNNTKTYENLKKMLEKGF